MVHFPLFLQLLPHHSASQPLIGAGLVGVVRALGGDWSGPVFRPNNGARLVERALAGITFQEMGVGLEIRAHLSDLMDGFRLKPSLSLRYVLHNFSDKGRMWGRHDASLCGFCRKWFETRMSKKERT